MIDVNRGSAGVKVKLTLVNFEKRQNKFGEFLFFFNIAIE